MKEKIDRRNFIKKTLKTTSSIVLTPALLGIAGTGIPFSACNNTGTFSKLYPATDKSFSLLEIKGSYYEIGHAIGENFKDNINLVFQIRKKWFENLKNAVVKNNEKFFKGLLKKAEEFYPHLIEELKGIADGAEIPFYDIFLYNIKAEIGAMMAKKKVETPGCSTIYLFDETQKYIFHNEDGNEANHGKMFMVKATPPSGVTFLVLTYPGILMGNGPGINNYGIAQTTNYIASMQWNTGVPRYFLNRAVLEAKSLDEAIKITTDPNRAFAYHHNLASTAEKRILSVEVTPYNFQIKEPKGIYFHTNHLILEQTKDLPQEDEYVKTSSLSRFSVISNNIKKSSSIKHTTKKDIIDILSSHENSPFSPCRHPEGNIKGRTLSTAIIDINNASIEIYKGNPCKSYPNNFFERYNVKNF